MELEGEVRLAQLVEDAKRLERRPAGAKGRSLVAALRKPLRFVATLALVGLALLLLATGQTAVHHAMRNEGRARWRVRTHTLDAGGVTDGADEAALLEVAAHLPHRTGAKGGVGKASPTALPPSGGGGGGGGMLGAEVHASSGKAVSKPKMERKFGGKLIAGPGEQVRIFEAGRCVEAEACSSLKQCAKVASIAAEGLPITGQGLIKREQCLNYVHMLMLAELPGGTLAAAWQASSVVEGAQDQRIWYAESVDASGRGWQAPVPLPDMHRKGAQWSPVLHYDAPRRTLHLFYAESDPKCVRSSRMHGTKQMPRRFAVGGHIMAVSRPVDGGASAGDWSEPRTLFGQWEENGIPKVVANRVTVLSTGEWLLPFWRQRSYGVCETNSLHNTAGVLRSTDDGATFDPVGHIHLKYKTHWVIEGSIAELKNGTLLMLLRSSDNFIFKSLSDDRGRAWSDAVATNVPNPDAKIALASATLAAEASAGGGDAVRVLVLAYNDHTRSFTGMAKGRDVTEKRRDRLKLAVSVDDGETWVDVARLDLKGRMDDADNFYGDILYHYPVLVMRNGVGEGDRLRLLVGYSRAYVDRDDAVKRAASPSALADGLYVTEVTLGLAKDGSVSAINPTSGVPMRNVGSAFLLNDPVNGCSTASCVTRLRSKKEHGVFIAAAASTPVKGGLDEDAIEDADAEEETAAEDGADASSEPAPDADDTAALAESAADDAKVDLGEGGGEEGDEEGDEGGVA